jgi:hypothetical protein
MRFQLSTKAFIEGNLLPAGTIINYYGPLGPHFVPLDAEAEARMDEYWEANPHASLRPVDNLPKTMGEERPMEVVSRPDQRVIDAEVATLGLGTLAAPGAKQPGLTDGGVALPVGGDGGEGNVALKVAADDPKKGDPAKPGEKLDEAEKPKTDEANKK